MYLRTGGYAALRKAIGTTAGVNTGSTAPISTITTNKSGMV